MPPPPQKSSIDASTTFTRTLVRNTTTPDGPSAVVSISLPLSSACHILSRTTGFCDTDGTVCIYYHSIAARTDTTGKVNIDEIQELHVTNNMPGSGVVPNENAELFEIRVNGSGTVAPVYWTCELSIVHAVAP